MKEDIKKSLNEEGTGDGAGRVYSYPHSMKFVGEDLVLASKTYFIILTPSEVDVIRTVVGENKPQMLHNDTLLVYQRDNHVVFEDLTVTRVMMVNITNLMTIIG